MPWKVSDVMERRFRLVERREESGESIAELARRFAISRKTAYKWLERYELGGVEGLQDRSRRPLVQAGRTTEVLEQWVVDLRHTHPSWGPRKLRAWLERKMPELKWPAQSTLGLILDRHGLSGRRKKRRRATPSTQPLAHAVIGVEELDDGVSRVWFGPVLLGLLDERQGHSDASKKGFSQRPPLQSPSGLLARRPLTMQDQEEV